MYLTSLRFCLLLLVSILFSGLSRTVFAQDAKPSAARSSNNASISSPLGPDDMIEVDVFQEPDLQTKARVSQAGTITFPLIGEVKIGGLNPDDAAKVIRAALAKDYLVNPQVTLTVSEYNKRRFTVLGEVQKPGSYEMPDRVDVSLLQAIGTAGGYTRIADPGSIRVKRNVNGKETIYKLNAKNMASGKESIAFTVQPDDVITVGESIF